MQAVRRTMETLFSTHEVLYQTGHDFLTAFVTASEAGTPLLEQYSGLRCWLLDDLGPLHQKISAQEMLCGLLDFASAQGAWVLLANRHLPQQEFLARLTSRLRGGLSVPVERPQLLTRIEILSNLKQHGGSSEIVSKECLQLIAEQSSGDVRQLEGAMQYLRHIAEQQRREIQFQDVWDYFAQIRRSGNVELKTIARETARHHGVRVSELRGPSRQQHLVAARGFAMQMARELTGLSFQRIGAYFGRRDHTTVLNACRKTQHNLRSDPQTALAWQQVREKIVGS